MLVGPNASTRQSIFSQSRETWLLELPVTPMAMTRSSTARVEMDLSRYDAAPIAYLSDLDLSRTCAAPSARSGHFPFESDGAFPAQCCRRGYPIAATDSCSAGFTGPGCAHRARPRRRRPLRYPSAAPTHPGPSHAESPCYYTRVGMRPRTSNWMSRPEESSRGKGTPVAAGPGFSK